MRYEAETFAAIASETGRSFDFFYEVDPNGTGDEEEESEPVGPDPAAAMELALAFARFQQSMAKAT